MARPTKQGIDYFPLDCRFDDKTEMFLIEKGAAGLGILVTIWQMIYAGEGYFVHNNRDLHLLVKHRIDSDIDDIIDCINVCLERNIFDKSMHEKHKILTSKAIQKRFFDAAKKKKTVNVNEEYMCFGVNSNINPVNVDGNPVNVGGNATNVKVKVKVKEKRERKAEITKLPKQVLQTSISDDFSPSDEVKQKAVLAMVPREIVNSPDEILKFIAQKKSRGKPSCDWQAEFFKWLLNAKVFNAQRIEKNEKNKSSSAQRETALDQTIRETDEYIRKLNAGEILTSDGPVVARTG